MKDQGNVCALCGRKLHRRNATVDHIIPRSQGGKDTLENTQAVHGWCNQLKGTGNGDNVRNATEAELFRACSAWKPSKTVSSRLWRKYQA